MPQSDQQLRDPVGRFAAPETITPELLTGWSTEIAVLPEALRTILRRLRPGQLDTPYRPGGWTVRQLVHHLPDSHMNAYVRFRWALTEDRPLIKAYDEASWAELPDAASAPIDISLNLLDAVYRRWLALLERLDPALLRREFLHPESGPVTLEQMLGMYAWHGRHHLAPIGLVVGTE